MTELQRFTEKILEFREARDWKQFHHPKDLALALAIEAAEVLEVFRFKSPEQIDAERPQWKQALGEELADCLYFILLLAHDADIDLPQAMEAKLQKNAARYPVELSRGNNLKYDRLGNNA
jgi:NTP pyrophosphatase (non-canonical NTP hydrolase)